MHAVEQLHDIAYIEYNLKAAVYSKEQSEYRITEANIRKGQHFSATLM